MPHEEYFRLHGHDPSRKLISYLQFCQFRPELPERGSTGKAGDFEFAV